MHVFMNTVITLINDTFRMILKLTIHIITDSPIEIHSIKERRTVSFFASVTVSKILIFRLVAIISLYSHCFEPYYNDI